MFCRPLRQERILQILNARERLNIRVGMGPLYRDTKKITGKDIARSIKTAHVAVTGSRNPSIRTLRPSQTEFDQALVKPDQ